MKESAIRLGRVLAPLLLIMFIAGCATRPKVDWNARIGNFTYNQAVLELGPPDKYARLDDGVVVAEWAMYASSPAYMSYGFGGFWGSGPFWGGPSLGWGYPVGPSYVRWLRLVFAPDGKLQTWRKYDR